MLQKIKCFFGFHSKLTHYEAWLFLAGHKIYCECGERKLIK